MQIQATGHPPFNATAPVKSPYGTSDAGPRDSVTLTDGSAPAAGSPTPEVPEKFTLKKMALAVTLALPVLGGVAGLVHQAVAAPQMASPTLSTTTNSATRDYVQLVMDDQGTLDRARQMIEKANGSIRFETSKLDGVAGEEIARSLGARAADGKTVEVLVDKAAFNSEWVEFLKSTGADVRHFDGDKDLTNLLIVDRSLALTGGTSFSEVHSHDVNVVLQGPGVDTLQKVWNADWLRSGGGLDPDLSEPAPLTVQLAPNARTRVLTDQEARTRLLHHIEHAHESIWMEMHGLDDREIMTALQQAKDRGINVNIILNRTDSDFSHHDGDVDNMSAALNFSDPLSPVPFRWYDGPNGASLGSRLAIFDNSVAIVGSTDLSSPGQAAKTHSVDLEIESPTVVTKLYIQFIQDWQNHSVDGPVVKPDDAWDR